MVQDTYMEKLAKEYGISADGKKPETPLPYQSLVVYEGENDAGRTTYIGKKSDPSAIQLL